MKKEETIDYNIKLAWHAIQRMYNQKASQFDMTISVGFILLYIDAEEGTPATKIAPQFGLEARSITRTLRNMEHEGLVYRVQGVEDRRYVRIYLTEKGKQKRDIARKVVREFNLFIQQHIDQEKLKVFFEVIQQINKLAEQMR